MPPSVFRGGSLLYGSNVRTDLLGTTRPDDLIRKQWHSARRLADALPDEAALRARTCLTWPRPRHGPR